MNYEKLIRLERMAFSLSHHKHSRQIFNFTGYILLFFFFCPLDIHLLHCGTPVSSFPFPFPGNWLCMSSLGSNATLGVHPICLRQAMSATLFRSGLNSSALKPIQHLSRQAGRSSSSSLLGCGYAASRSFYTPCRRPLPASLDPKKQLASRYIAPLVALRYNSSSTPAPSKTKRTFRAASRVFTVLGIAVASAGLVIVGFFVYDATTYRGEPSGADTPVSELALNPRRGGPKDLPIADVLLGDQDTAETNAALAKPRLVILGTGWGSIALLKSLRPGDYHVTVVSPRNYFLFTPFLPSATVGTLGLRSLVEPIRRIIRRVNGHFLKATAEDVDFKEKLIEVSQVGANGVEERFYVPYDKLVLAVGTYAFLMLCFHENGHANNSAKCQAASAIRTVSRDLSIASISSRLMMRARSRIRSWRIWNWRACLRRLMMNANVCCHSSFAVEVLRVLNSPQKYLICSTRICSITFRGLFEMRSLCMSYRVGPIYSTPTTKRYPNTPR